MTKSIYSRKMCKGKEKTEEIKSITPTEEGIDTLSGEETEEEISILSDEEIEPERYLSEPELEHEDANADELHTQPTWAPFRINSHQPISSLEDIIEGFRRLSAEVIVNLAFKHYLTNHPASPFPHDSTHSSAEASNIAENTTEGNKISQISLGNYLAIAAKTSKEITLHFTNVYPDDIVLIIPKSHLDSPSLIRFIEKSDGKMSALHGIKVGIPFDTVIARIQSATLDLRHIIKIIMDYPSSEEE